jgi:D-3-phosphoglycerate dehydrogenase
MPYVPMRRLREQTLGVVGFGRIGRTLARKALGVGARVIAADPMLAPGSPNELDVPIVPLAQLLERADFVSLHVPLTPETHHLIGEVELAAIRPTAYLINCARGPVVDQEALLRVLEAGRLAGAGLDVTDPEPPSPQVLRRLLALPNVIVTPHVAWYSEEALADRRRIAAETVRDALLTNSSEKRGS